MITFFLPSLEGGGAERTTLNLVRGLVDRGLQIELVITRGGRLSSLLSPSVPLHDLQVSRVMKAVVPLARYLRDRRPEAIIGVMDYASVVTIEANRIAGSPSRVISVSHSNPLRNQGTGKPGALLRLLMRVSYPSAWRRVAVSRGVAETVERVTHLGAGSVLAIPNAVVTPEVRRMSASRPEHPAAAPLVVGLGRLIETKNWGGLIEAVRIARSRMRIRLTIAGDGPEHDALQRAGSVAIGEDFRLEPFLDNPFPLLASADILALASRSEGSPNVLVEAMACGTAVVSTDCAYGPSEILEGGKWGRLVEVDRPDLLAEAIEGELLSPRNAGDLRRRAEDFSVERIAETWERLLAGEALF